MKRPAAVDVGADQLKKRPATVEVDAESLKKRPAAIEVDADSLKKRPAAVEVDAGSLKKRPVVVEVDADPLKKRPATVDVDAEPVVVDAEEVEKQPKDLDSGSLERPDAGTLVHLIDALPYFFRAYFGLPPSIKDPSGRPSNAVVGFANFLLQYLTREAPTHIAFCWDRSLNSSFRNEFYPAYKANRDPAPPSLADQIQRCIRLCEALGIACFDDDKYEADDLLASLVELLLAEGHRCTVVSCDKDLCQLVGPHCIMHDYAKGERYNEEGVREKLGVRPSQVPDFLGLAGDTADNIPGVKGLGPKTASALLASFGDLDAIYAGLGKVAELPLRGAAGIAAKLEQNRDAAFLSRRLATLARDVRVVRGNALRALRRRRPKGRDVTAVLEDLGLSRLRPKVDALRV